MTRLTGRSAGGAQPARFRLRGTARAVTLILHVLSSVGWFGVAVGILVLAVVAGTTADQVFAHHLYRVLAAAPQVSVPLGLVGIATGTVLGLGTRWGLIRNWWVVVKTVIAVAAVTTDATLFAAVAREAVATGRPAPPLFAAAAAHVVVLVIAVALSVIKPRGLTPWGRAVRPAGQRANLAGTSNRTQ